MPLRLLFADSAGCLYAHPELRPAIGAEETLGPPRGNEPPRPLPAHATLSSLPGRRPIGVARDGSLVVLHEVKIGKKTIRPDAVGCVLPPGYTRLALPAYSPGLLAPVLPQWAYTAVAALGDGNVSWSIRSDTRRHWDAGDPRRTAPALAERVRDVKSKNDNPLYDQIAKCAQSYRCFTAQNTFLGEGEGAIPASTFCNAHCVGCISEQIETGVDPSHERMTAGPSAEQMADLGASHLETARGDRVMVSFGQGCEGEPLTRGPAVAEAIALMRKRTPRGSININTNGSLPDQLARLVDAGLDAVRVSLNSADPDLYAAYYRPVNYTLLDVEKSIALARRRGVYVALNLLTFPGVSDRAGEVDALEALVRRYRVHQVQTRSLAMDPAQYLAVARGRGAGGAPIGMRKLLARIARRSIVGNFARGLGERS